MTFSTHIILSLTIMFEEIALYLHILCSILLLRSMRCSIMRFTQSHGLGILLPYGYCFAMGLFNIDLIIYFWNYTRWHGSFDTTAVFILIRVSFLWDVRPIPTGWAKTLVAILVVFSLRLLLYIAEIRSLHALSDYVIVPHAAWCCSLWLITIL